ncbi:sigma-70 family RNA polymerase sigma factor [Alteribacter aurantiacus]|uniref:sigma-70 family RNA polymerase sigma factor n=1 Tax=Alteribacter aurantiacus TaxID=254410 RepID=UPI0004166486|nr:sigma-70 family RNA polymerase sigma factor [Alteribacter aurantiacus]
MILDNVVAEDEHDDEDILSEFIDDYYKDLINLAYTYVKDWGIAEDVVQESLIKAVRHMDSFHHQSSIKTWVYRITMNQAKDYLRKSYVKRVTVSTVLEKIFTSSHNETEAIVLKQSEDEVISEAIMTLPLKYREIILFYYYKDFSVKEISDLLDEKESTIKSKLQRGRKRLKLELEKRGIYNGPEA